ncbi:hypothetical protein J437_LFUL011193 [Ladona fulva]|uniref:Uncharacterized protein n=1 Tax=Ladona fulva TaxID=123851 RepID=A0A8K0KLQ9_LADFU|nr:hypothetical protein J437_LFUL011193 [Ladona fulva]
MRDEIEPGSTCLHEAVKANDSKCVQILLEKGADAGAQDFHGRVPLELAGTRAKICLNQYLEILESLIKAKVRTSDHAFHIALLNALHQKSESAVLSLLRGGANPWVEEEPETALHVAASSGMEQPLKIFIKEMQDRNELKINVRDHMKRTALHRAAYEGHSECTSVLIRSGADLSLKDESEMSCLEAVLLNLPKSVTFFLGEMDHAVSCKVKSRNEYFLRLNFGIFTNNENERQTALINIILQSTLLSKKVKSDILVHPLVDTFCAIKWSKARVFFFLVVVLHFLYVVSLSTFTVLDYYKYSASSWTSFFRYIHMFFATFVLINATSLPTVNFTMKTLWRRKAEVTTLLFCASLSIVWAFATIFIDADYLNWSLMNGWAKKILLFLLPLSWLALMLMIGRYRAWGWRALLFGLVFKNTILTLGVLFFLLIGFSLSFFVAFKPYNELLFGNPWLSLQTTFVMMTGEYNYNDLSEIMGFYTHLLFILFVVVATLVINNLVVALAVNDANALSEIGDSRCLKKKLEFVYSFELMSELLAAQVRIENSYVFEVTGSEEIGFRIHPKLVPERILGSLMEKAIENPTEEMEDQVSEENSSSSLWNALFSFIRQESSTAFISPV